MLSTSPAQTLDFSSFRCPLTVIYRVSSLRFDQKQHQKGSPCLGALRSRTAVLNLKGFGGGSHFASRALCSGCSGGGDKDGRLRKFNLDPSRIPYRSI